MQLAVSWYRQVKNHVYRFTECKRYDSKIVAVES